MSSVSTRRTSLLEVEDGYQDKLSKEEFVVPSSVRQKEKEKEQNDEVKEAKEVECALVLTKEAEPSKRSRHSILKVTHYQKEETMNSLLPYLPATYPLQEVVLVHHR